jgi:hypothetical protein
MPTNFQTNYMTHFKSIHIYCALTYDYSQQTTSTCTTEYMYDLFISVEFLWETIM